MGRVIIQHHMLTTYCFWFYLFILFIYFILFSKKTLLARPRWPAPMLTTFLLTLYPKP
jgi:hypothetical protein